MAIVGILMALLMPAVLGALEDSRQSRCRSNLRQWSLALVQYSGDHDGQLTTPGAGGSPQLDDATAWFNALPPYMDGSSLQEMNTNNLPMPGPGVNSIFMCPTLPDYGGGGTVLAYSQNELIEESPSGRPALLRMRHIKKPSLFVFLGELDQQQLKGFYEVLPTNLDYRHSKSASKSVPYAYGRGTRTNLAFVDGHSEDLLWKDIYSDASATSPKINLNVMWNPFLDMAN